MFEFLIAFFVAILFITPIGIAFELSEWRERCEIKARDRQKAKQQRIEDAEIRHAEFREKPYAEGGINGLAKAN